MHDADANVGKKSLVFVSSMIVKVLVQAVYRILKPNDSRKNENIELLIDTLPTGKRITTK